MKESEIDAKVHAVLRRNATNRDWKQLSVGNAVSVGREVAVEIARELGVIVKPDAPVLPDRLDLHFGTAHDSHAPCYTQSDRADDRGLSVTVCGRTACDAHTIDFCRTLVHALIAAYNDRPRRYTGDPQTPGYYAVRRVNGKLEIAAWRKYPGNERTPPTEGWETGPEVAAWQPIVV